MNEVLGLALRTLHGDRRMHVLLSISGLINHPEIIGALARAVAGQLDLTVIDLEHRRARRSVGRS